MQFPKSIIQEIEDDLAHSFQHIYETHIDDELPFSYFSSHLLNETVADLATATSITTQTLLPVQRKINQTKKRWMENEFTVNGKFHDEIDVLARGIYEQFHDQVDKLSSLYGFDNFESLRQSRIEELENWAKDKTLPTCSFRYISGRRSSAIAAALRNDMTYRILKTLFERCPHGVQSAIVEMPHSLSRVPIDYTRRIEIDETEIVERNEERYFRDVYQVDDHTILENLMNVEILKTGVIHNVLKRLNSTDIQVFLYVLSLRDSTFFETRTITVDVGDIVRHVFNSDNQSNYQAIRDSLMRMAFLTSGALDSSRRGFTIKLFDNVQILKASIPGKEAENPELIGREVAQIEVNSVIVTEYVKNQTIKLYKDIIRQFTLEASKIVIFPLQRERIRCDSTTTQGQPLVFETNFNFFRGVLSMSSKNKTRNIALIENVLNEFIKNGIAVKSFERKRDTFTIEFQPITQQERQELLDRSGLLIEGPFEQMTLGINTTT